MFTRPGECDLTARGEWVKFLVPGVAVSLILPVTHSLAAEGADPNRLKPGQVITRGPPPQSPAQFDPDANRIAIPTNALRSLVTNTLSRSVSISTNFPPAPPPMFNPDPGAAFRPAPVPAPGFVRDEPALPPQSAPAPIPGDRLLPRENVRSSVIGPEPPLEPKPTAGYEPLPKEQELPRENTRRNLRLDEERHTPHYSFLPPPPDTQPKPDRWRVGFTPWKRYTSGDIEQPFESPQTYLWHPYKQSLLKGDAPVIGDDIFLNLTASTQTDLEFRRVPVASGVSAATPGQAEFYGQSDQIALQNNLAFAIMLFKGETVFKPVEWAIKLQPVFNLNYLNVQETGIVSPDPRGVLGGGLPNTPPPPNGGIFNPSDLDPFLNGQIGAAANSYRGRRNTVRTRDFYALQEYFAEIHLRDLSDNYDFIAAKAGNQVFNSDFRGFIFNDVNLGARFFGNLRNNIHQYNVALFDMREKDTNSELNTFDERGQRVLIANFYWQDFLWKGYTAQWSFHGNWDEAGIHYDENGNIVRPAPIGTVRPHAVDAYYFGWAGDGHIGRFNISHAFYQAFGHDNFNGLAGRPVDINAQMAALELSYDRDWVRYKFSAFYASGDGSTEDGTGTGFDTILDNPNFTGGPFSWYVRQGFNLGGTAVNLKQRGSLVPNLRTSKTQGQANFVNPGVFIVGVGTDIEVTPKLRAFVNANYIRFMETDPIKTALLTDKVAHDLGFDLSLGAQYRPLLTDNIILSAGFGVLIPGRGFRDIYQTSTDPVPTFNPTDRRGEVDDFLYSGVIAVNFTY